jgi:hypothetical protein
MGLPVVLALASLALSSTGEIAGHIAQKKAAAANRKAALEDLRLGSADIAARRAEEGQATALDIVNANTTSLLEQGTLAVNFAENGVTGATAQAAQGVAQRGLLDFTTTAKQNLRLTNNALDRQQQSLQAQAQQRIAGVQSPSKLATGVRLAGHGISAATQIHNIRQPRLGSG